MDFVAHMFPTLSVLEAAAGGTVNQNPGCPTCGYLGWIPVSLPQERESPPHSAAGRPRLRHVPTR
jgi:hypothetical protein